MLIHIHVMMLLETNLFLVVMYSALRLLKNNITMMTAVAASVKINMTATTPPTIAGVLSVSELQSLVSIFVSTRQLSLPA